MFTSNFARSPKILAPLRKVSIARKAPGWYKGASELMLAPSPAMLAMSTEEYIEKFEALLSALKAKELFDSLGENAVLLCWESPGVFCHRRRVAQWFETELGITVPEYGFEREGYPVYPDMPEKGSPEAKRYPRALVTCNHAPYTPTLF